MPSTPLIRGAAQLLLALLQVPYAFAESPRLQPVTRSEDAKPASGVESAILVVDAQNLTLKFSEVPRLNGDYRVNADHTISIPGLGRIAVSGMTAPQLEKALSDAVTGLAGREIFVTVEVAEYKPVFVTGDLAFMSSVPWRPGLTVEQAIAVAGAPAQRLTQDTTVQRRRAQQDQYRLIALMARLQAEREQAEDVEIPEQLVQLVGRAEAAKLIEIHRAILQNRRAAVKKQLEMLAAGKAVATEELESLRLHKSKIEEQLELRRRQRDRIQALFDRKLTVADRALEESIKVSDLEEKAANISVSIARVQSTIVGFNRETLNADELRKAEVDTELVRVDRELAQLEAILGTSDGPQPLTYSVMRQRGKATSTSIVTKTSLLMPGDLLTVARTVAHND